MPAIRPVDFPPIHYRITKGPDKLAFASALLGGTPAEFTLEVDDSRSVGVVTGTVERKMLISPFAAEMMNNHSSQVFFIGHERADGFTKFRVVADYGFQGEGRMSVFSPLVEVPSLLHEVIRMKPFVLWP